MGISGLRKIGSLSNKVTPAGYGRILHQLVVVAIEWALRLQVFFLVHIAKVVSVN